jgi:dihydroorotate dehydrogenase electron transfer subunit
VGRGTQALSRVRAQETLDVLGPLGNGFELPSNADHVVLVGGGVGIPPVYLLAKSLLRSGLDGKAITYLCGLTTASERPMAERVEKLPIRFEYATDDGSLGFKGFVTNLLRARLTDGSCASEPIICACGPDAMLKAVKAISQESSKRCYLSLESIMPCGVGTCLGCVVKKEGDDKFLRVCREGPVFEASEVEL